jgi:hypothetical protein
VTTISRRTQKPKLSLPREVQQLERNKKAEVTKSKDGTVTRRRNTAKTQKELTTRESQLGERTVEYKKTSSTKRGSSETNFRQHTDLLGRTNQTSERNSTNTRGDQLQSTRSQDVFGIDKQGRSETRARTQGNTETTTTRTNTRDSVGNRHASSDVTRVTTDGTAVRTTNERRAAGSELTTRSKATYENGRLVLNDGADWTRGSSFQRSSMREFDASQSTVDRANRAADRFGRAADWTSRAMRNLGIEQQWQSELSPDRMRTTTLAEGRYGSVTSRVGVEGRQSASIGPDGITGEFNRAARASVTAESAGRVEGRYGTAEYNARAHAEAVASIDARGSITPNGIDATITARVGVSAEAEINASARTGSVRVAGVDLSAGIEGRGRVSAEAVAEATGTARITRNPPTAVLEGTAGASAVVKAEGSIRADAGPFSFTASGYASAGAEATASGVLAYENGRLRIGGSVGAALGVGLGGGVAVEVDVAQIGQMAHNAADRDGDGQLGLGDVVAGARQAADLAGSAARTVARAADRNGDGRLGLDDVGAGARQAATAVAGAATRVATGAARAVTRAADVDGDGRLGLGDAAAAARNVGAAAANVAGRTANAVANAASAAGNAVASGARSVGNAVGNAASAAGNAVASGARRVASFFGW